MYIERSAENLIEELSEQFPAVLLTGARQVGKTTMLKKLAMADRRYVSLDVRRIRDLATNDPELFVERYRPPIIIDEIQYAPELLPPIKAHIDREGKPGDYWLTGSQMFQLMEKASESLAGRVAIVPMQGLTLAEIKKWPGRYYDPRIDARQASFDEREKIGPEELFARIFKGAFPRVNAQKVNRDVYYDSYVTTYIERDIRQLTQVADELSFYKFLTVCAAHTGSVLDYTALANEVDISSPTAKKWLSLLVSTGLVYLLGAYHASALKRAVKSPKMYFMDTGLCAYLARWNSPDALEAGAMSGAFFETWTVSEIVRGYYNAGKRPPLSYARDSNKNEIDLIVEMNNTLYPNEIKKTSNPGRRAAANFSMLDRAGKEVGVGNVLCMVPEITPIDRSSYAIPVWTV
jgi:predicted AAA+ superfamily ATPase